MTLTPAEVFRFGDRMQVAATGFNAGEKVQLVLYYRDGKPVKVGNFVADAQGALVTSFALPKLDAGTDVVQVTGWDSGKVGTAPFLMGATWVKADPTANHAIWLGIGALVGLAVFALLAWFGVRTLRRLPPVSSEA